MIYVKVVVILKKSNPVILVTPSFKKELNGYFLNKDYCNIIERCGGVPVAAHYGGYEYINNVIDSVSGVVLTGGGDISPDLCGLDCGEFTKGVIRERDMFESNLFLQAITKNIPVLGICRGMQLMCMATGGKICEDISLFSENAYCHDQKIERNIPWHKIDIKKDSVLFEIVKKKTIYVNSLHHQCVKESGNILKPCAFSKDGVMEAVESKSGTFMMGVQWHPESMGYDDSVSRQIFKFFINKAIQGGK